MTDSPEPNYSHFSSFDLVMEFHDVYGATIDEGIWKIAENRLRVELIREELQELDEALVARDFEAVADALADLDYVVNGAAVAFGIHLPTITAEVHRSNMTKLSPDGSVLRREDGKVLKGPDFQLPNIEEALNDGANRFQQSRSRARTNRHGKDASATRRDV